MKYNANFFRVASGIRKFSQKLRENLFFAKQITFLIYVVSTQYLELFDKNGLIGRIQPKTNVNVYFLSMLFILFFCGGGNYFITLQNVNFIHRKIFLFKFSLQRTCKIIRKMTACKRKRIFFV